MQGAVGAVVGEGGESKDETSIMHFYSVVEASSFCNVCVGGGGSSTWWGDIQSMSAGLECAMCDSPAYDATSSVLDGRSQCRNNVFGQRSSNHCLSADSETAGRSEKALNSAWMITLLRADLPLKGRRFETELLAALLDSDGCGSLPLTWSI